MNVFGFSNIFRKTFFAVLIILWGAAPNVKAQIQPQQNGQEVYLAFHHRSVINNVITAYYAHDTFYLPVLELFNLLEINAQTEIDGGVKVHGTFLNTRMEYEIDFGAGYIQLGKNRVELKASDYILKELDFYVSPAIYEKIFDLKFTVDFSNLVLDLQTPYTLPVVAKYLRQKDRERLSYLTKTQKNYTLKYNRKRHFFNAGFLDYTLSSNVSSGSNIYTYNTDVGVEVLGGDFQGSLLGSYSDQFSTFTTNNLRWRYVPNKSSLVRQLFIGQVNSMGLINNQITGIKISNEPIRPRTLFDEFVIDGSALPRSDVELYLNNALLDFQEADELGNYRFNVPLTYGNSRLNLRIYGPNGQLQTVNQRIQIPFTFLPPGETNYNITAGYVQNPLLGTSGQKLATQSKVTSGLTNWLTASAGIEYFEDVQKTLPTVYGSLSARLFKEYLVNAEAAPDAFYRVSTSVVYPSSLSLGFNYTNYQQTQGIYNLTGAKQELSANFFIPFGIGSIPLSFRGFGTRFKRPASAFTRYQFDFNTRLRNLNLRLGYRDNQVGKLLFRTTFSGRATAAATYTLSRIPGLPAYLRGAFLRTQANYNPELNQLEDINASYSQNIGRNTRFEINFTRNIANKINIVGLNLTIDFNKLRNNSNARLAGNTYNFSNTVRGSIGYDRFNNRLLLNNRQQVGRSGAAVRLYVDNNNSNTYDKGDEIIAKNAVRLKKSGASRLDEKTGITYLTQLLPYDRYNVEINKGAIPNPLIVPKFDQFSFISDPNAYKPIDIPLYISGIIDGTVQKVINDSTKAPVAGLKLYLSQKDGDFTKEIRTFSDGSFYAYEIPPGDYTLSADSTQLQILGTVSTSEKKSFEIKALSEGDFVTGLNFTLVPKSNPDIQFAQQDTKTQKSTLLNLLSDRSTTYEIQLESFKDQENAQQAAWQAQRLFKESFRIKYNSQTNFFTLRSYPISGSDDALNKLFSIQNSQFQNAVLVVTLSNDAAVEAAPETKKISEFSVQLGAFSSMKNAISFCDEAGRKLGIETKISFDESIGLYKVQTVSTANKELVLVTLKKIRASNVFDDAFLAEHTETVTLPGNSEKINLNYAYNILVKGVTTQTEQAYLSSITEASDVDINLSPKKDVLVFENIETWKEALKLKQKLSQISTMGKPFIVLVEHK